MLIAALIFFILAIIAAFARLTGLAIGAAGLAESFMFIFVTLAALSTYFHFKEKDTKNSNDKL